MIRALLLVAVALLAFVLAVFFVLLSRVPDNPTPEPRTVTVEKTVPGPQRTVEKTLPEKTVERTVEKTVKEPCVLPDTGPKLRK